MQFVAGVVGNEIEHFSEPLFWVEVVEFAVGEEGAEHGCENGIFFSTVYNNNFLS